MPLRQDVWTHDSCLVCQSMHSTEEDKNRHEMDASHKKKIVVYDFLSRELSCLTPSNQRSLLYQRYYRANSCVAGLDCICELNFSWTTVPMWACTICYVAGETLESADDHMHCSFHKRNYICEYHPDRYANLLKVQEKSAKNKQSLLEQEAIADTLLEAKGLLAPDVYVLSDRSKEWAFQKLGLTSEQPSASFTAEDVTDNHKIALCYICGEAFISFMKEDDFREAWFTHISTGIHQRCKAMQVLVHEDNLVECEGVPAECELRTNVEFRRIGDTGEDEAHYGPTVGLEHLIIYYGNECFCALCFAVLSNASITDHFSSEYHIERFVKRDDPGKLLNTQYLSVPELHGILSYCYEERPITSHKYFRSNSLMPLLLRKYAFPERRLLVTFNLERIDLGRGFTAIWCEECKEYINMDGDEDAWSIHIFDDAHFERAATKALHHYDDTVLTRTCAQIENNFARSYPPNWDEQFSVSLGVIAIQDQCEFGLEFIIRDALSAHFYCACCFVNCGENDTQMFSKHARSFDHIVRAMHSLNKKTMITLNWRFPSANDRKPLLMDYLTHYKRNFREQKHGISVYNPALVYKLNCSSALPKRLFQLAKIAPSDRINFITTNEEEGTPEIVPLSVALNEYCRIEVKLEVKETIICHCEECAQSFSESLNKLDNSIEEHLLSLSHWQRTKVLNDNQFDESQRIRDRESKIKVSPYQQQDPKKKVTWKWNDKKASYEFVYAQLGLEDIRERRRNGETDFFCTLCAQSFKAAKLDLECHIRSFAHLFYFMHKHRPAIIPELQAQITADLTVAEKHKNIRRLFARTLKGCEADKKQHGIPIYDLEERECEYADVKKALEEDKTEKELRKNVKPAKINSTDNEIFDLNTIKLRNHKWINGDILDRHFTIQIERSNMDISAKSLNGSNVRQLEQSKQQLLGAVQFDGLVQLEDGAAGTSTAATVANVEIEKQQKEQTEEPIEKTKKKNAAPSKDTTRADDTPTSTNGRVSTVDIPRDAARPRAAGHRRRSRSTHRRRRQPTRSPPQQRRSDRHRSPDYSSRSKKSESPSSKKLRKERDDSNLSSRPPSTRPRSKSVSRRPSSRPNTPPANAPPDKSTPLTHELTTKRLHDLKMSLMSQNMPRQFFPPLPSLKPTQSGAISADSSIILPPPPPGPVPPVPGYLKKSVGGVYDAAYLAEAFPDILRKSQPVSSDGVQTVDLVPEVATSSSHVEVSSVSQPSKGVETNKVNEPEEMRNQLMNRLKKSAGKEIYQKIAVNIPKDLPAFKQQALIRQQSELLKSKKAAKKLSNDLLVQQKQMEEQREELQAISPEPDEVVELIGQQQQQRREEPIQQGDGAHKKATIDLAKSKWDFVSGKFVSTDTTTSQPDIQPFVGAPLVPSASSQQGMPIPKIGVARNVLSQLAMSTSAITAQQIFSGQQTLANVPSHFQGPATSVFGPSMPTATSTRPTTLLGQQPLPSSAPFSVAPFPPNLLGTINSALGVPMGFPPPPRFHQPPLMMGYPPPMQQQQQHPAMMSTVEMIMCTKAQLYSRDLATIDNIAAFIEYMWKQGYDPIPPIDPPLLLNEVLSKRKGLIGASTLYQIICFGHPELETFYCGMCNHWTTVSEMFNHLRASMHRLSYMFRNYKMYHRKAMEEMDEERRDLMLERFASKIWEIEGCGRCTNRMRCILNEEAIRRIWPDYINCIDNSWKIVDDDDELQIGLSQPVQQRMDFNQLPLPQKHSAVGIEPSTGSTVFVDQSVVRAASAQVRASIVAKKLELAERTGHPGIGLVSLNSDKRSEETDQHAGKSKEKKRPETECDGGKGSKSSRSERRKDKLKEPSKSNCSSSRSKRSQSRERDDKRGDKERERGGRRRSRSKERGTKAKTDDKVKGKGREESSESWAEKAAQFLHKIGDTKNATKLYWEAADETFGPSGVFDDKRPKTADKLSGSQSTPSSSLMDRLASAGQSMLRRRNQIDEREQQQVRRQMSPDRPTATEKPKKEKQRQQQRTAVDDKSEMRKAIAVMVELQQEYENNNGYLTAEMFFSTCQEFNISPGEVVKNGLLCETANELGVDLHGGLQSFMHKQSQQMSAASSAQFNLQSMGVDTSKLRGLDPKALQSILSKANVAKQASAARSTAESVTPMRSRFELHEIALDESMAPENYVYPSYEEGIAQQRPAPTDIDSNNKGPTTASRPGQDGADSSVDYTQKRPPQDSRVVSGTQQAPQLLRNPFLFDGQPRQRGDPRSGWGIPPDPKGAGGISRTDPRTKPGFQQRGTQDSDRFSESEQQPMDVDFTDDMGANWFSFSKRPSTASSSKSTAHRTEASLPQHPIRHQAPIASNLGSNSSVPAQLPQTSQQTPVQQQNAYHANQLLQIPQQQLQQVMNPDVRRIAEEVGEDWNSLESFSFEMLGFGSGRGMEPQLRQSHPSPPPP